MGWIIAFSVLIASIIQEVKPVDKYESITGYGPDMSRSALSYCKEHKRLSETVEACMRDLGYQPLTK